jgi:malic enzyme
MSMTTAAVHALARAVAEPSMEMVLPDPLDRRVAHRVAAAVRDAYEN